METFSADWLALREPADHAARSTALLDQVVETLNERRGHASTAASAVRVLDLGSGSGSNLRYLAPRLPFPQHWHLLDHDAALLATAMRRAPAGGLAVETHRVDLRVLPDDLFSTEGGDAGPAGATLVTGSALLDLVSASWLEGLADRLRTMGAVALFVLSYDGRIVCDPADPWDAEVRDLVNRHQRTDKGFGPATGPDASAVLTPCLAARGYVVHAASSDWDLAAGSAELQRQLIAGWAEAAAQLAPARADEIAAWQTRRLGHVASGRSRLRVGHQDVLAWPATVAPPTHTGGRTA